MPARRVRRVPMPLSEHIYMIVTEKASTQRWHVCLSQVVFWGELV
jgi:hypothetical protein